MAGLPSGTVTMLFSDIEGSTLLLSRLGADYAQALTGQRTVLRKAWAEHGGTEIGTEGDSFFVVFATATAAATAAAQAQRGLEDYPWPRGEHVRVRMGVHTGSPTVQDDGYVGMDVHRAARVAGAAHGGQVIVSDATAHLVQGSLPDGVGLRDLGAHQLKDMPVPEHLFQLQVAGLEDQFPPLKSLGTASSLPTPPTALVGRDGELAELAAAVGSPHVRLVTLTGPGGSGKTRLAIGLAKTLVDDFPDGVFFVPLATVTTAEVMWTTIAETLDVPPEGRIPPGFFTHVAHRSALLVLDNLEQLPVADAVVAELLSEAPQVVVVATSRRPLHVMGEHEHAVPPLELPEDDSLGEAEASGAVQLFINQARKVRPSFTVTADNSAAVAAISRRLDGLPLALELAASRTKLLSPRALLARLDQALDFTAASGHGPSRQKTLRDTIAWSCDLLTSDQRGFFRRLGVFAGGADLDAIAAVIATDGEPAVTDPLDVVADLVDASLVTVKETPDGEPRIGMLETVRVYALDELTATGELEPTQQRHALHYLRVAEQLSPRLRGGRRLDTRAELEAEHDNFREALSWALQRNSAHEAHVGLCLCAALGGFWTSSGYFFEGRRWLEQAIGAAGETDSPELARCLSLLADILADLGDYVAAHERATSSLEMARRLGDTRQELIALRILAGAEVDRGRWDVARPMYEQAVRLARESGEKEQLRSVLSSFAMLEGSERNYQRQVDLDSEALAISRELGDIAAVLVAQHNMAAELREGGNSEEAKKQMERLIPDLLKFSAPDTLSVVAEDYAAALAELGSHQSAVRLLGSAEATRERLGTPRHPMQEADIAEAFAKARAALTSEQWDEAYGDGRNTSVEDVLTEVPAHEQS